MLLLPPWLCLPACTQSQHPCQTWPQGTADMYSKVLHSTAEHSTLEHMSAVPCGQARPVWQCLGMTWPANQFEHNKLCLCLHSEGKYAGTRCSMSPMSLSSRVRCTGAAYLDLITCQAAGYKLVHFIYAWYDDIQAQKLGGWEGLSTKAGILSTDHLK